jgi:hypothetical protein
MNTRQSWVLGAAIVLGCLILGLFFGGPSVAQKKKEDPATPGRYRFIEGCKGPILIDTITGRIWMSGDDKDSWEDFGRPATGQKENPSTPGRYRAYYWPAKTIGVVDTLTGRTWTKIYERSEEQWKDLGSPAQKKK